MILSKRQSHLLTFAVHVSIRAETKGFQDNSSLKFRLDFGITVVIITKVR